MKLEWLKAPDIRPRDVAQAVAPGIGVYYIDAMGHVTLATLRPRGRVRYSNVGTGKTLAEAKRIVRRDFEERAARA